MLLGTAGVLIVVAVVLAVFLRVGGGGTTPPATTIGLITVTQLPGDLVLLENKKDNYQITVSPDWIINEEIADLTLYFNDGKEVVLGTELEDTAILTIRMLDNAGSYGFDEWFNKLSVSTTSALGARINYKKITVNGRDAFRSSRKIDDLDDYGKIVLQEDSSIIDYLLFKEAKVYWISCVASGSGYQNLIKACEDRVQTFSLQ